MTLFTFSEKTMDVRTNKAQHTLLITVKGLVYILLAIRCIILDIKFIYLPPILLSCLTFPKVSFQFSSVYKLSIISVDVSLILKHPSNWLPMFLSALMTMVAVLAVILIFSQCFYISLCLRVLC